MGTADREAVKDGTKTRAGHGKQKGRDKTRRRNACEVSISREVKRMHGKGNVDMLTGYNTTKDLSNRTKDATHTQRGHTGSWYAFDSTLGFPGEGHEKGAGLKIKEKGAWVTVNVAGVHVVTNDKASRIDIKEASDKLVHNYSDKLWELVNVYTSLKTEVMMPLLPMLGLLWSVHPDQTEIRTEDRVPCASPTATASSGDYTEMN